MLLDRPLVAGEQPPFDRREERLLERVRAPFRSGLDDEVDVDLEVARADGRLHPVAVPARLRERPRDGGLAHAEEAEHAAAGRPGAAEKRAKGVRLERVRPQALELRRRPRQHDDDAASIVLGEQAGRGAGQPERDCAVRNRRLLRHAVLEVGVRTLQPLGRRARDGVDLLLELGVDVDVASERARDHLHRAVVVRRPEPAGDEARVSGHALAQRRLELVGRVADDDDPRRLETEPQRFCRQEGAVSVGALPAHELAAGDDDDRPRTGRHALASAVRDGVTTTRSDFRAGSETDLPFSVRRRCCGWRMRIQKR